MMIGRDNSYVSHYQPDANKNKQDGKSPSHSTIAIRAQIQNTAPERQRASGEESNPEHKVVVYPPGAELCLLDLL